MKITYFDVVNKIPVIDKAKLIKEAGFDGVFLYYKNTIDEEVKAVRDEGLFIETIHLEVKNCNHLWLDTVEGEEYLRVTKAGILSASKYGVETVIFHISSKNNPPMYNELGLKRLREILDLCEEVNVNFAVENLRRLDYLDYVFDNLKSDKLKFCFDSGHANAFTNNIEDFEFEKYSDFLICIHLNDNDGTHDSHLNIFSGNIDFKKLGRNLRNINYSGPITSEAIIKDENKDLLVGLKEIRDSLDRFEKYIKF